MAKYLHFLSVIILLTSCSEPKDTIFEKLESKYTGLVFENRLTHNVSNRQNLFDYDYFYNGAGVGVEDLNNDGTIGFNAGNLDAITTDTNGAGLKRDSVDGGIYAD